MKVLFIYLARSIFHFGTRPLTVNEREGIRLAARFMFEQPGLLVMMLLTGLGAAVFEGGTLGILGLAVGVLTDNLLNSAITPPEFVELWLLDLLQATSHGGVFLILVGIAVIAQIIKSVLTYISTVAQVILSYGMQRNAQDRATEHVMNMAYDEINRYPSGQLSSLVDQSGIVSDIVSEVGKASRAVLMAVSYVCVMVLLSPMLTIAALFIFGIVWVVLTKVTRLLKELSAKTVKNEIRTWRWTVEYLNAPRLLRIFDSMASAEKKIKGARQQRVMAEQKSGVISAGILPAFEVVTVFGAGLFLIAGYVLAGDNAIEVVPKLFVFVLVFFRIKPQIKMLNDLRFSIVKLLPRLEVVGEFLMKYDKVFERKGGVPFSRLHESIEFRSVSFNYPGVNSEAVVDLEFILPRGKTVALVGASGAGKSTIVDLLLDLYEPTKGEILVDGRGLSTLDNSTWRGRIGVVDQEVYLLNDTILQNIGFGRDNLSKKEVEEAALTAHAHEFISQLENGYKTVVGDRGYRLSGGQQQRIALARALVHNPDILILDEATSALDSISEKLIQQAIEDMHKSRTILLIAHRLSTIDKADNILVLDEGRVVESGTKEELIHLNGTFTRLWKTQAGITI